NAEKNVNAQKQAQELQQAAQKDIMMMEFAAQALNQAIEQGFKSGELQKNQALQRQLQQMKAEAEKAAAKKRKKAANQAMIFQAGGMILGGAAGAFAGGPAGAAAGMSAGGQLGTLAAG